MKQLIMSEETTQKALFYIVGAYKIMCKMEKSELPDNRLRARDAATLIEIGLNQIISSMPIHFAELLQKEITKRERVI